MQLLRAAKARAAMSGRGHVIPDDVQALTPLVLAHRLMPSAEAQLARRTPADVLTTILGQVPVPAPRASTSTAWPA
ncbi:hypothetical protein LWF15_22930 [Kineosporia rhizophila]|nr:hypothetical protein [Kineosporia rhizophila]